MIYTFQHSSFRDHETGLYNQSYFMEVFSREWYRLIREQQGIAIITSRIAPDFTRDSETNQLFANVILTNLFRASDLASRFDNNEFIIGLFNLDTEGLETVLDRLSQATEATPRLRRKVHFGGVYLLPNNQIDLRQLFMESHELAQELERNKESLYKYVEH